MKSPDIAQVSKVTGVPASSLRYYEERGLISAIGRRGLRRVFGPSVYDRLAFISLGRKAGFSLAEIAQMLGDEGPPKINKAMLAAKAHEINLRIRRLTVLREGLLHASTCPESRHVDCPKFQRLLKLAASETRRKSKP